MFDAARATAPGVEIDGSAALVAGDRQTDGIFPLWSIAQNISIGSLRALTRLGLVDAGAEAELAAAGGSGSASARPTWTTTS